MKAHLVKGNVFALVFPLAARFREAVAGAAGWAIVFFVSPCIGLFKDKKSFALEIAVKPLVMASEIAGLEPLRGFIKQENRVVPARFRLAKKRAKQPEFVSRTMPELRPRPQIAAIAPAPQLVAAAQSVLPLAPATPKPAFVWNESQGID